MPDDASFTPGPERGYPWAIEKETYSPDGKDFEFAEYVIVTEDDEIGRCYDEDHARVMAASRELLDAGGALHKAIYDVLGERYVLGGSKRLHDTILAWEAVAKKARGDG